MKSQTIFFVLFSLSLMLLALTAVQAQSNRAAEWKRSVAEQSAAAAQTPSAEKTEARNSAAETAENADAQSLHRDESEAHQNRLGDARSQQQNALAGSWDLTLTFSDGSTVKSRLTVSAGRRDGEGAVIHAAEASLLLPNPTTPEQGAWEHVGGLRFIASYSGFAVDEKFEKPAGKIGFRHAIRLSADQETFTGRAVFEVRDPEGNVVFSDNIQTQGKRQHPEAP
jgi:hypothetical protein